MLTAIYAFHIFISMERDSKGLAIVVKSERIRENDRMLRTSPCPVVVVRGEDDIWAEFEEV